MLNDGTKIDVPLYSNTEIKVPQSFLSYTVDKFREVKDLFYLIAALVLAELIMAIYKIVQYVKRKST